MAPIPLDNQTAGCKSPHEWLVIWPWIKLFCVIFEFGTENGTNGHHLAVFSINITFTHHFVAPHHPPPSIHMGELVALAMPVKKLSKMVGNTASYPFNSWCIDRI